jgi:hypothetical protein
MTKEEKLMYKSGDREQQKKVEQAMYADGRVKIGENKVTVEVNKGAYFDPYSLVSGGGRDTTTTIERVYADHAVAMKELAREARKLARAQVDIPRDPAAAKEYANEVRSLEAKLALARKNAPLERQAQLIANQKLRAIVYNNPDLPNDKEHYKREKFRQLEYARKAIGAKKLIIGSKDNPLTDKEWTAIQKGAVSKTTLKGIMANADKRRIKELAMPKTKTGIPNAKLARAKTMMKNGYGRAEIADMLDIPEGKIVYAMEQGLL